MLYKYLNRESTVEARTMLIINYLSALLIEGRNNQISIHKNFENKMQEIRNFETENKDTLHNLKAARDKLYAHIDLDWQKYAKSITFDEFECCIKFLNDLFDYRVFDWYLTESEIWIIENLKTNCQKFGRKYPNCR